MAIFIHMNEAASGGLCLGMRRQAFSEPLVKTHANRVIGVKNMHPFACRTANAFVEITDDTDVSGVAVKCHSAAADFRDDGFRIIRIRAIIDYLDLHLPRTRILRKHTQECVAKITGTVVDRDHDRPKRAFDACREESDGWWDQVGAPDQRKFASVAAPPMRMGDKPRSPHKASSRQA